MKHRKVLQIFSVGLSLLFLLALCSCSQAPVQELWELAYDNLPKKERLVYLVENGAYEPYIVLTKDYYGNVLLLRKYVMDERRAFNIYHADGFNDAYYPDSWMDRFLSDDFYDMLSPVTQSKIVAVDIDITTKESIGIGREEMEKITRKVFLLSYYEITGFDSPVSANEGIVLSYFTDMPKSEDRIGYFKNGESMNFWLRTPNTGFDSMIYNVSDSEGMIGPSQVINELGVRPVFCMSGDTKVFQKEVEGLGSVYVIE